MVTTKSWYSRFGSAFGSGALAIGALAALACGDNPGPLVPHTADVCGPPPVNREQDLSQEARAQIAGYVSAGAEGSNRQRITQLLSQQGLMCDALVYRSCMAAYAAKATPDQMRSMMQLAMSSCQTTGGGAVAEQPTAPPPVAQASNPSSSEWTPGRYMGEAIKKVSEVAKRAEQQTAYGWDDGGACVLGAFLKTGKIINMGRRLPPGEYAVLGVGNDIVTDLDIGIEHEGSLVAKDTDDDPTPAVEFNVTTEGVYTIHLKMVGVQSSYDGAFAAIAIMRKGGLVIPSDRLLRSFETALGAAGQAARTVQQRGGKGLVFHEGDDWSFLASVLAQGEEITFNGFDLLPPMAVVLAGGDQSATDLDLVVKDGRTGAVMQQDQDHDANPAVIVQPQAGGVYSVGVKNVKSNGRSLVSAVVLRTE